MRLEKVMIQPHKKTALTDFARILQRQIELVSMAHKSDFNTQKDLFAVLPHNVPICCAPGTANQTEWHKIKADKKPVFVCIGTELVNGDSLGPLVGYQLSRKNPPQAYIYGTLQNPIHALNLNQKMNEIKKKHPDSCIIAIDASFGSKRHLGAVSIHPGPLYPGLGVSKSLPPVGDISITGIVCTHGPDCNDRLRDTPLSLLIPQVDMITEGIIQTLSLSDIRLRRQDRIFPAISLPDRILQIRR